MKGPHYVCEVSPASTTWFPKGISLRVNLFQFILEIDWLLMFPCLFIFLFFTLWFSQINSPACVCKKYIFFFEVFFLLLPKLIGLSCVLSINTYLGWIPMIKILQKISLNILFCGFNCFVYNIQQLFSHKLWNWFTTVNRLCIILLIHWFVFV